jgi:hypothetical protein
VESRSIPTELAQWLAGELARLDLDPTFTSQALLVEASYRCFYRIRSRHRGGEALSLVAMESPPWGFRAFSPPISRTVSC